MVTVSFAKLAAMSVDLVKFLCVAALAYFFGYGCVHAGALNQASYAAEKSACVQLSETRAEAVGCLEKVNARYGVDAGVDVEKQRGWFASKGSR